MVQVDLITGFLGAGKTTFLRRYAAWWAGQGVKVCVLENDFGAVNVDAMLLQDLEAQGVELETISGGRDCDTHQRRMRTKLISMAMRGFERVIVEPSGIFDVDEFFDVFAGRAAGPLVSAGQCHRHRGCPSAGRTFPAGRISPRFRECMGGQCPPEPLSAGL